MNFYSDEIINNIIDNSDLDNIISETDSFKLNTSYLFHKHSLNDIHYKYIDGLLDDDKNRIAFYCMDSEFSIFNCPTMMIYQKYKDPKTNEIRYYILLMCTKFSFRGQGYASKLLDGFVAKVREDNKNIVNPIKIILSSVENSVLFYESYGFKWKSESISDHKILMKYEKYESDKEYFILELLV